MNSDESPATQIKRLQGLVSNLKEVRGLNTLSRAKREAAAQLRDSVAHARVQIDNYYTSDDTKIQAESLALAVEQLHKVNEAILLASSYDILDSVDVSLFSAKVELLIEKLR